MTEQGGYIENLTGIKGAVLEWAKLKDKNGAILELLQYHEPVVSHESVLSISNMRGFSHVAFTVDDIDSIYEQLKSMSFLPVNRPILSPDGMVKVMYAYDPDGIIVEVVQVIDIG